VSELPNLTIDGREMMPALLGPEQYATAEEMTFEQLLALVRSLNEEQRHEVAKAAGVSCWKPWHRAGFW
jgi:hypothetical protein